MKKGSAGAFVIVIVISLVVGAVLGYSIKYYLGSKNVPSKENGKDNNKVVEKTEVQDKKDAKYFNEYLLAFTSCTGEKISRNTQNFSDLDIYYFVENYYSIQAMKTNNLIATGDPGENACIVAKSEVRGLISKYFNTNKELNLSVSDPHSSIMKMTSFDNNNYKLEWKNVGCRAVDYKNSVVEYDGYNVKVTYDVVFNDNLDPNHESIDKLVFNLKYNNGNYNIISIEEK